METDLAFLLRVLADGRPHTLNEPYPKSAQLERGPQRPKRLKARPLEWLLIRGAKFGPCRARSLDGCAGRIELHHIVPRAQGGDDVSANIAPLCTEHHRTVTSTEVGRVLAESLTDAEYAYAIGKLGEGALERLFGVMGGGPS